VYSRIVPHALLESTEFADLYDDTYRLLLIGLNLRADDFGNQKGDPRQLLRWAVLFTQIEDSAGLAAALTALEAAGLVRAYVVDGKPYLNLPGFKNARTYARRQCPPSPWCDPGAATGAYAAGMRARSPAASPVASAATKSESEFTVKVGVAEETKSDPQVPVGASLPAGWAVPDGWIQWAVRFREDQARPLAVAEVRALADRFGDLRRRKEGLDGGKIDWLGRWRNWVCAARAGGPT
jgi:hypothetical protein